jgi:mannose-6-phosphate isomerase-like protein (cupin superfamily)
MPILTAGDAQVPSWCELIYFDIVYLTPAESRSFVRMGPKEKLIVGEGDCTVTVRGEGCPAPRGSQFDRGPRDAPFSVTAGTAPTILIRMAGCWGEEVGGSGLFEVIENKDAPNPGDPVAGPRNTAFDNHFHDCDEYWIIYAGSGVATSEGKLFDVGPSDCIVTGMGWHHDFPIVHKPVKAVFFETTMEGAKRPGHLWEHAHGPAEPKPERV